MNGYITRRTDKCGIGAANAMRQKWKREREWHLYLRQEADATPQQGKAITDS